MIEVPSGGRSRSLVPRSLDRVEERLILATCLVLAGVSVVGAIFEWPPAVYQPITFLALYAVLRILLPLRETPEELRQARMELAELKERLLNHECVDFRCYESSAEFYGALTEVVNSEARRQIDAWYVRKVPPTKFVQKAAKRYFSSVLQWAKNDSSRSVRRLICVHSPEMREWARRHHAIPGRSRTTRPASSNGPSRPTCSTWPSSTSGSSSWPSPAPRIRWSEG